MKRRLVNFFYTKEPRFTLLTLQLEEEIEGEMALPFSIEFPIIIVLWWTAAACIVILFKGLYKGVFPYPFCSTLLTNTGVFVMCGILTIIKRRMEKKTYPKLEMRHHVYIATFGAMQGLEIGFINMALADSALSMRTMVMSTNTMFMLFSAQCWGLPPKLTRWRFVCMLLFVAGGCSQGISAMYNTHEGETHPVRGFFIQIIAMTISAQRWALIQWSLQEGSPIKQRSKIELTARMVPPGAAVLIFMVGIGEPEALSELTVEILEKCVLLSALIAVLIVSELRCVQLTSAVTFFVCGVVHNIPIVMCGVWFFGETLHFFALFGFFICIVGTFWYAKLTPIQGRKSNTTAVFFDPIHEFDPERIELDFDDMDALDTDMTNIYGKTDAPVAKKKKGIGINLAAIKSSSKTRSEKNDKDKLTHHAYESFEEENDNLAVSRDSRATTPEASSHRVRDLVSSPRERSLSPRDDPSKAVVHEI